jgi:D-aspartate ligase
MRAKPASALQAEEGEIMRASVRSATTREWPMAIVLCSQLTGLATVRALASQGVEVLALVFDPKDPLLVSRYPRQVVVVSRTTSDSELTELVCRYAAAMRKKPVLLVTSDARALWLSRNADTLSQTCTLWSTPHDTVNAIVRKESLYDLAERAGVPVVQWTRCDDLDGVAAWSARHAGPYLVKPSYGADRPAAAMLQKNRFCEDAASMLGFLRSGESSSFLVQQLLAGGDGEIFDTYGLCDRQGQVRSISTHRRWRQFPPNLGTTTFGEIPANAEAGGDELMIAQTLALLAHVRYHGIFGIEWLRERKTGRFCLIDFNARPFTSIGHLRDCGVNLPWLGYRELIGDDLSNEPLYPALKHRYWLDLHRDCRSKYDWWNALHASMTPPACPPLWRVSSFAYWDWRDPGPIAQKLMEIASSAMRFARTSLLATVRG